MTTNRNSTVPLIVSMIATLVTISWLLLKRSYRIDPMELDRIENDIRRTESMVDSARNKAGGLTSADMQVAKQQAAQLGDRLLKIKAVGPESLPARALELLAFAGMFVSIIGSGLFIYRKAVA
tara:strand:- start:38 stop:406 length:369 start_codon:yes stop_codon:yes gene_type:complete